MVKKKKKKRAGKGLCTHPLSIPFFSSFFFFQAGKKISQDEKPRLGGSTLMVWTGAFPAGAMGKGP